MKYRLRMKTMAYCVGAAMTQLAAGLAYADSGVGVDTALGNALNPPGRSAVPRAVDPDAYDTVRRSPTGQLYGVPLATDENPEKTASGWEYSGGIEAGILGGDANEKNALFRKYKDLKNGPYLSYFEAEGEKKDTANYFQAFGGGAGRHDQFYGVQYGKYNDWKVKLFYNEIIHTFTDTWKQLYSGEGTGDLSLAGPGLAAPTRVTAGTPTVGTGACSATAPCWQYTDANGVTNLYSNAAAVAAIRGVAGTYNAAGTLIAGSPQSNQAQAIAQKTASSPDKELSLVRKKGGLRVDATLTDFWKGYASYSLEKREGARPLGMVVGNQVSTDIAEPINYDTHEFLTGLSYADSLTQANLRASLSMFRNNISTLNVQYPLMANYTAGVNGTGWGGLDHATFDLYPNNDAFNLKGEYARSLPDLYKGRFTAALSWGTNRQDDALLAPISAVQAADLAANGVTNFSGNNIGYAANTGLVSNWNTTAALSQQTAKQRIDNTLVDLGLSLRPADRLGVKGTYRFYQTHNKGGYTAYNPLTGQFGRGPVDNNGIGTLDTVVGLLPGKALNTAGNCYAPPGYAAPATCTFGLANTITTGANTPVFGEARSTKQTNYGVQADYDLTNTSSINAAVEREEFWRNFRERQDTWEDKVKLGYVNRALGNSTLRLSYETDRKRGGEYRYRTFEDLGTGLPGLDPQTIVTLAGLGTPGYPALVAAALFNRYSYYFRKYDQADRNQNIVNARLNTALRDDMDLGVMVQVKRAHYPNSFYGLQKDDQDSLGLDFNYQPSGDQSFYAFYNYQQGKKEQYLNSGIAPLNTSCTLANVITYGYSACSDYLPTNVAVGPRPLTSKWSQNTDDRNDVIGFGLQRSFGRIRFGMDYTYSNSKTKIDYRYGNTAINAVAGTQAAADLVNAAAGYALPNMTFVQQTLNLNVLIPVNNKWSVRLYDRLEVGRVKDWHYDNVISGQVLNYETGSLLLDGGYMNYHANVIGVLAQYKL